MSRTFDVTYVFRPINPLMGLSIRTLPADRWDTRGVTARSPGHGEASGAWRAAATGQSLRAHRLSPRVRQFRYLLETGRVVGSSRSLCELDPDRRPGGRRSGFASRKASPWAGKPPTDLGTVNGRLPLPKGVSGTCRSTTNHARTGRTTRTIRGAGLGRFSEPPGPSAAG